MTDQTQPHPRVSGQALIGLLFILAAVVVRRIFALPDYPLDDLALAKAKADAAMGGDIADMLLAFGSPLVAWAKALPAIKPPGGGSGNALTGLLVGVGLSGLTLVLPGCGLLGPVKVEAEHSIKWERRPGPTCYVRTLADGEVATETTAPTSCVPPPEFCQAGPGEPGYVAPVSGAAP